MEASTAFNNRRLPTMNATDSTSLPSWFRSFNFYEDTNCLTDLSLAAKILRPGICLPALLRSTYSPGYLVLHDQDTITGHCRHTPCFDYTIGAPKYPHISFHRDIRIIGKYESSGALLAKRSFHAWVGALCDQRRMSDPCQTRMDIVLGELKKEGMETAELSLRKIDSSF